jgi:four helix bundle protein
MRWNVGDGIRSYRDLIAWKKAYALGLALYVFSTKFPEHERFGLTSTIRRSALLVARQIAEGYGKQNAQAYAQSLRNARTTTYDIDTQIAFVQGLGYVGEGECVPLIEQTAECGRVISGLLRSVEGSGPNS